MEAIKKLWIMGIGLFVGALTLLQAETMVPNAPVINFKLPRFGEHTYKIWMLEGREGHYVSDEQIDVVDMHLTTFSGDSQMNLETRIESPQATMWLKENKATGPHFILIQGEGFTIMGKDWTWEGEEKKVRVEKEVRVTLQGDNLSNILG